MLSENDQKVIADMEKQFEEMTGKKPTHVFIDTKETIEQNSNYCTRGEVYCGECKNCIEFERTADIDGYEQRKRERIAEQNEY